MSAHVAVNPEKFRRRSAPNVQLLEFLGGVLFVGALSFLVLFLGYLWRESMSNRPDELLTVSGSTPQVSQTPVPVVPLNDELLEPAPVVVQPKPSAPSISELAQAAAAEHHVRAELILAIIAVRSAGDAGLVSARGEKGLMQLMPLIVHEMGIEDPLSPEENIRGGARYLSMMFARYGGDEHKALAAFLVGPAWLEYYGGTLPPDAALHTELERILQLASATH